MGESYRDTASGLLRERGSFSSGDLTRATGLTRQALHRHLTRWTGEGWLVREGQGRGTRYRAAEPDFERSYPLGTTEEEQVWLEVAAWLTGFPASVSRAADQLLHYAVTELVNNAIDHSGASTVTVAGVLRGRQLVLTVTDEGIGAFESVRGRLGLEDHLHALQELSKGKVTTQPERHSGEGLFFVSKMAACFVLEANGLAWTVDNELPDQALAAAAPDPGTCVRFEVSLDATTSPEEVFAAYTHGFAFDTTRCVVRLFEHGTRFVSRSEAKRLVSGLTRFRQVILDFHGVEGVGQGFVDEVFRVWARQHPEVTLTPRAMNPAVEFMVRRGLPG